MWNFRKCLRGDFYLSPSLLFLFIDNDGASRGTGQSEKEVPVVTDGSDLFVCKADDNLNLDNSAFRSYEDVSDVSTSELICSISTTSGTIKAKPARIEVVDENNALTVKMFTKNKATITLKNDEQVILQCPGGSREFSIYTFRVDSFFSSF